MPNINPGAIDNGPTDDLDLNTPAPDADIVDPPTDNTPPADAPAPPAPEAKGARAAAARALATMEGEKPGDETKPGAPAAPAPPPLKPGQELDPLTGRVLDPIKAPASMTPELREQWGTVPRRMQQYWSDRERHIATELGKSTEARKFYDEFRGVAAPYEPLFKQHGMTATTHAKQLFEASYALTTGTPQQKAAIIVQMMRQFQPDGATMQALISGQPANIQPFQAPQAQLSEDQLAERALAKRDAETFDKDAASSIGAFEADPKNEFYADVKQTMGQLIGTGVIPEADMGTMLRQAYDLAVARHSGIQEVLKARQAVTAPAQPPAPPVNPAPASPTAAPTAPPIPRPTPSAKPSTGGGAARSGPPKKFGSSREAARAALESSGWID